jgi:hypothetical protein
LRLQATSAAKPETSEVFKTQLSAILGEGIACNQDPDSLHCKALKRAKSLGELKIKSLAIIRLILILSQFF